jgi:hypothetical protein
MEILLVSAILKLVESVVVAYAIVALVSATDRVVESVVERPACVDETSAIDSVVDSVDVGITISPEITIEEDSVRLRFVESLEENVPKSAEPSTILRVVASVTAMPACVVRASVSDSVVESLDA